MKAIIAVTLVSVVILGASAPSTVLGSSATGLGGAGNTFAVQLIGEYQRAEGNASAGLAQFLIDHNVGTPRHWQTRVAGFLSRMSDH